MKILLKINILLLVNTLLFSSTGIVKEASNVINTPSLKSKINYIASKGDIVHIIKKVYTKHNGTWHKLDNGYVSYELIKLIKNNKSKNTFVSILVDTKVYKDASFNSKIINKINADTNKVIIDTKYIKGNKYPWYKLKEGWVNTPFLNIKKFNNNTRINTNINENKIIKNKPSKLVVKKINKDKDNNKNNNKVSNKLTKPYKRTYNNFVGISAGYSYMDAKKNNIVGNIPLNEDISTNGMNVSFEFGIRYPKYFYTLNYENINYDDVEFNRFLLGAFKTFDYKYNPYIGVLAGMSFIELKKSHFNTTIPKAMGKSNAFGIQFGLEHKIYNNISFNPYIRYINTDHKTILKANPARAKIIRNNNIDLNIGFRYDFY